MELGSVGHKADLLDARGLLAGEAELRIVVGAEVTGVLEQLKFLTVGPLARRDTSVTTTVI